MCKCGERTLGLCWESASSTRSRVLLRVVHDKQHFKRLSDSADTELGQWEGSIQAAYARAIRDLGRLGVMVPTSNLETSFPLGRYEVRHWGGWLGEARYVARRAE